ncbi:hypothetical protein M413DRAFT_287801 [Hebeloma cylindrosporum]|uniref:Uncharacterized protein n=1 Tax=Hebeloma cylindrosporum TaxID=76867 RepID=A0A0C2Y629_HEBCY|nr:hypothetical protein M413DRAFT_287801 [Hebeloma cylindrosporum h7]
MTSPFAVWLLPSYHANIFMTVLFALIDPSVSMIESAFSIYIYDGVRTLEEHWETMLNAIQTGVLPNNYELGEFRSHIEAQFNPNPDRAEELRKIQKGEEGWLKRVWPSLTLINSTFSGMFASPLPKLRHHFGPSVQLKSGVLAATEGLIGLAYDANDTNLYRLEFAGHIEFLDITEKEGVSANLVQPWQVEVGKKYEVVITNKDGLWRYQLHDIVEVAGFSPEEGIPLIRFVERKGVAFRVGGEFFTESFLRKIIGSLADDSIGRILEFTTVLDERNELPAYGFLVEIDGEIGRNPAQARVLVQGRLQTDIAYKNYCDDSYAGDPTIRVLKPGTFKEYRQWKGDTNGISAGQIKVPTMLTDAVTIDWLAQRVMLEV